MSRQKCALLLAVISLAWGQAHAGLFSDDEAREQIEQLGTRVAGIEDAGKQQADINKQQADTNKQLNDSSVQQSSALLDLQSQLDAQDAELRTLRGQNEEMAHGLEDAQKRQKDFYIDLDTRLRHIEELQAGAPAVATPAAAPGAEPVVAVTPPAQADAAVADADDPAIQNRAYESAFKLFKDAKYAEAISAYQEFLKRFPESVYAPIVQYQIGNSYLAQKNCKDAIPSLLLLPGKYAYSPKTPDALLSVAACQAELGDKNAARKTMQLIVNKYPASGAASEAKKRLASPK